MPSWDVVVAGRVVRVRSRQGGGWRVRLADTGGALAAAEIRASHPLLPPPVGSRILIRGRLHYREDHGWYVVDPVEEWREARNVEGAAGMSSGAPAWSLSPMPAAR